MMKQVWTARLTRFGLMLLLALALLGVIGSFTPTFQWSGADFQQRPVSELITSAMWSTMGLIGRGLLYSLPFALLIGGAAALWPGRWFSRLLQVPVPLLASFPIILLVGQLMRSWQIAPFSWIWAAAFFMPWTALALRDGLLSGRDEAGRVRLFPAVAATAGRLLQSSGDLLIAAALLGQATAGLKGQSLLVLIRTGILTDNMTLAVYGLGLMLLLALVAGLLGDLLISASARWPQPARSPSKSLVGLGLLLAVIWSTTVLLIDGDALRIDLENRHAAPSSEHRLGTDQYGRDRLALFALAGRTSLKVGLGVTAVAGVGGFLLGWGAMKLPTSLRSVLAPRRRPFSFFGPVSGALLGFILMDQSFTGLIVGAGLGSVPMAAYAFRRWFGADRAERRLALQMMAGSLLLVAGGAMAADLVLGLHDLLILDHSRLVVTPGYLLNEALQDPNRLLFTPLWAGIGAILLTGYFLTEGAGAEPGE